LRREIIATQVANGLISRMGGAMVAQLAENTGMPLENIAYAYLVVREAFGLSDLWEGVETLLNTKGVLIVEAPHFLNLVKNLEYDTIYHEHLSEKI